MDITTALSISPCVRRFSLVYRVIVRLYVTCVVNLFVFVGVCMLVSCAIVQYEVLVVASLRQIWLCAAG